jgi:hypothetical protein
MPIMYNAWRRMMDMTQANRPTPKTPRRMSFWRLGICSFRSSGTGTATRIKSVAMLMPALEKVMAFLSMHTPWTPMAAAQYVSTGQQVKMEPKMVHNP